MDKPQRLAKFELVSTDGGQCSANYSCHNMLNCDGKVYCTKKKGNVNIVLKYPGDDSFVLTHIIVKAPEHE